MYKIPVVVPYHEDELLASWVFRLAEASCVRDVRRFVFQYFYPNEREYKFRPLHINFVDSLYHFWLALGSDRILPSELLIKTTTFTGIAPFLGKEMRQKYLCRCFHNGSKSSLLFSHIGKASSKFRFCPECKKAELDNKSVPTLVVNGQCINGVGPIAGWIKNQKAQNA